MRPGQGTAGLRWLKFPARYFSQEEPEALSLLGQKQEGAGAAEARTPGSRVTGAGGGARRLSWSGRWGAGGSVPLSRLADCQPLPGGWWGRAGTGAGAATLDVPPRIARARASWEPGLSVLEWRVRRVAARDEGETHARPAPSGANTSPASSPCRAPERRSQPWGPGFGLPPAARASPHAKAGTQQYPG